MREAGRIVTDTMNKAISRLQPGVRQFEVIADVYHTQITGFDNKFGDCTSLCPLIQVGEGTSTPHLTWTDEPLPDTGLVAMEIGAARRHYHAPLTRTMHIGPAPDEIVRLTSVIVEGGDEALAMAKPGVTCEEVEAGMCFHFQAGMWLDDFGAAVSEPFVVTEGGGERLSDVARELIVID